MLDVDLYVFGDEKSIGSGFKSIKPPYIPLLPHKCHFLLLRKTQKLKKLNSRKARFIYVLDDIDNKLNKSSVGI